MRGDIRLGKELQVVVHEPVCDPAISGSIELYILPGIINGVKVPGDYRVMFGVDVDDFPMDWVVF